MVTFRLKQLVITLFFVLSVIARILKNALINCNCVLKFDNNCQVLDSQESWSKREVVPGRKDWTFIG